MRKKDRGFTLIELLTVISIISVLSSITMASLNSARAKARDARRIADLHQIQLALNMYYLDYGKYPEISNPSGQNIKGTVVSSIDYSSPRSWTILEGKLAPYISTLPVDPINRDINDDTNSEQTRLYVSPSQYVYIYSNLEDVSGEPREHDPQTYDLITRLETDHLLICTNRNWISHSFDNGPVSVGDTWCNQDIIDQGGDGSHIYADH